MKRRYKILKIVVLLSLLSLLGCAPKMVILLDGQPIPDCAYMLKNPQTGLSIEVVAAKYIEIDEEGEPVLWPVYFSVDKMYSVDPDNTKYIKIEIKIRNPNKVWYEFKENVLVESLFGKVKSEISTKSMYKGRLRYNKFEIFYPVKEDTTRKISVEVKSKKGLTLFVIGDFSYKVNNERGDADQKEGM